MNQIKRRAIIIIYKIDTKRPTIPIISPAIASPLPLSLLPSWESSTFFNLLSATPPKTIPRMEVIKVNYREYFVGAVSFDTKTGIGAFEYDPSFVSTGIELSPVKMPLAKRIYSFPELGFETYKGLPGLIADSLPDDFGNAVLNAWVASKGKQTSDITPLQRLQYTGKRGMGAIEYAPAIRLKSLNASQPVDIESLVSITQEMLDSRKEFELKLNKGGEENREAMMALLAVGMRAGGARPKAVLAFNENFTQVRSGQVNVPSSFTHYLILIMAWVIVSAVEMTCALA